MAGVPGDLLHQVQQAPLQRGRRLAPSVARLPGHVQVVAPDDRGRDLAAAAQRRARRLTGASGDQPDGSVGTQRIRRPVSSVA